MRNHRFFRRLSFYGIAAYCLAIAVSITTSKPAVAAIVTWDVDADGLWHIATNWSSNPNLPGTADDVTIARSTVDITVSHSQGSDTIKSLTCNESLIVSGGSLSMSNASQINNNFTVSGGTVNFNGSTASTISGAATLSGGTISGTGAVTIASGRSLAWTQGSWKGTGTKRFASGAAMDIFVTTDGTYYLAEGRLENAGNIVFRSTAGNSSSYNMVLSNESAGTIDFQSNGSFMNWSPILGSRPTLENAGKILKSSGSGVTTTDAAVNNPGTVEVQSGTLRFNGPFNNSGTVKLQTGTGLMVFGGGASSGIFNVATGASLTFGGGTHNLTGAAMNNLGTLNFGGGTVNISGSPVSTSGVVALSGGTISAASAVTIASGGRLDWTQGSWKGTGTKRIALGAVMDIFVTTDGTYYLAEGRLENAGNIYFRSTGGNSSSYSIVLSNESTGTIDFQSNGSFMNWSAMLGTRPTLENAGKIVKSSGSGVTTTDAAVNNPGTVEVQSGTLKFNGPFNNSNTATVQTAATLMLSGGGSSAGTFEVAAGANLTFGGGTHNLTGATLNNLGAINFSGGTENFNLPVNLFGVMNFSGGTVNFGGSTVSTLNGAVTLSGGAISGTGAVTIPSGKSLAWTQGSWKGTGTKRIASGAAMDIFVTTDGTYYLAEGRLENAGNIVFRSTGGNSSSYSIVLSNESTGTIDLQSNGSFMNWSSGLGGRPTLENAGRIVKSSGTGVTTTDAIVNNPGTVDVQSGTLQFKGPFNNSGAVELQTGTALTLSGGGASSGTFEVAAGASLNFTSSTYNLTGGTLDNLGTVEVQGSTLNLQGGVVQLVGDALTGGSWKVMANSTLNVTTGSNITVNQGGVTLDGIGSTFSKIDTLSDNQGSFAVLNGRNFTTMGNLANAGLLTVGTGSDFVVSGNLTGTGSVVVNGTMTAHSLVQDSLTIGSSGNMSFCSFNGDFTDTGNDLAAVPEPTMFVLIILACVGIAFIRLRRIYGAFE